MAEEQQRRGAFRTSIGGQALIEGILMRGPEKQAIVVRSPEGLVTKVEELLAQNTNSREKLAFVGDGINDAPGPGWPACGKGGGAAVH